jgi:branched-chain amino acid transport system permease protein
VTAISSTPRSVDGANPDARGGRGRRALFTLAVLAALLLLAAGPWYLNGYWIRIGANIFMYVALALGINLMAGHTGYPAFANVVYFGIGGYATAVLTGRLGASFAATLPASVLLCALLAMLIGPPLLRLGGHYFAIATLGLNEAIRDVVSNTDRLTSGGMGISLPLPPGGPAANAMNFYFLFLGTAVIATWITWEFSRRRLGIACQAIRDNEVKAEACGLYTTRYKNTVWMISAAITGAVGSINAYWMTYIDPSSVFDMAIAVKSFVIFLLGGAGTVLGPIGGAVFVELLATYTWSKLLNWHRGAMGFIIMLVIAVFPHGLHEALQRLPFLRDVFARRRRQTPRTARAHGSGATG